MTSRVATQNTPSLRWIGASGGILFVLLQIISQALIQTGGAEPPFSASAEEILSFFASKNSQISDLSAFVSTLSTIAFLWFIGALWASLREAEGEPAWLSLTLVSSGVMALAAVFASGGWQLATYRFTEGLDPQIARLLFDSGNLGFANMWVPLASLLFAYTGIVLRTGELPRWTGWAALIIGVSLLAARAFWAASGGVFMAYVSFWGWIIAVSIILLREAARGRTSGS